MAEPAGSIVSAGAGRKSASASPRPMTARSRLSAGSRRRLMKLSDDMLFGHPVLSAVSDDFRDALFDAEFAIEVEDEESLKVEASIRLNCPDLDELLEQGAA